jgi:GNAT superfamily N-acetyltransferase
MGISFRPAGPADVEALAALVGELGYPSSSAAVGARLERLGRLEQGLVLVAEEGGRLQGWVHVLAFHSLSSDPCALVAGLVVRAGARRRGIGRALLERAEGWAREQGLHAVRLRSGEARSGAHAFYRAQGYRLVKRQLQFRKQL